MPLNAALHESSSIPALSWDAFGIKGLNLVKSWSMAVGKALTGDAVDPDAVQLAGRACVVESQLLNGITLGRSVADAACLPYVNLNPASDEFSSIVQAITQPTVIHLEPGAWQADCRKLASEWQGDMPEPVKAELRHIQATQAMLLEVLQSRPVVYLTLAKEISAFSGSLQKSGGFDRQISLGGPIQQMAGALWISQLGGCASPRLQESQVKVAGLTSESELNQDIVILRLKRLAAQENRAIELADLIDVLLRGTTESDVGGVESEESRKELQRVAWHEAGHALITVINSNGQQVPDYASACRSAAFGGVVVSIREQHQPFTYADLRHDVRVALAGRAAEEVAYGCANVSNGAANDLAVATRKCSWAFSTGGLAPGMDEEHQSGSNLAVVLNDDPAALAEVRGLVQRFLADEYAHVLAMLRDNRQLLDALAQRLVVDRIVDQGEIREILSCHEGCSE